HTDSADFQASGQLTDVPAAVLPARSSGEYMQPITYENQCRACHPVNVNIGSSEVALPHRLQPKEVDAFLKRAVIGVFLDPKQDLKFAEWTKLRRPLPGRGPHDELAEKTKTLGAVIDDQFKKLRHKVWLGRNTCGECHNYKWRDDEPHVPSKVLSP